MKGPQQSLWSHLGVLIIGHRVLDAPKIYLSLCYDQAVFKSLSKQVDELPSKNQALCEFCVTCIVLLCVNLLYSLCKLNHC